MTTNIRTFFSASAITGIAALASLSFLTVPTYAGVVAGTVALVLDAQEHGLARKTLEKVDDGLHLGIEITGNAVVGNERVVREMDTEVEHTNPGRQLTAQVPDLCQDEIAAGTCQGVVRSGD